MCARLRWPRALIFHPIWCALSRAMSQSNLSTVHVETHVCLEVRVTHVKHIFFVALCMCQTCRFTAVADW